MATLRKTAEKTAGAVQTIERTSAALAKKLNIDISPLPDVRRYDPDFGRAAQLEHLAGVLSQINEAVGKTNEKSAEKETAKITEPAAPKVVDEIVEKPKKGRK